MNKHLHLLKQQNIGVGRKQSRSAASVRPFEKNFIYSYLFLPFVKEASWLCRVRGKQAAIILIWRKKQKTLKALFLLLEGKVTPTCVNVRLRMWKWKTKYFLWASHEGSSVMASLFPQEKKNIKAIQICYIKAALAALLFDFWVFPQTWIHLDPHRQLMERRCRLKWSSSELMRGSRWSPYKGSCRAARWVRYLQSFRGQQLWLRLLLSSWIVSGQSKEDVSTKPTVQTEP